MYTGTIKPYLTSFSKLTANLTKLTVASVNKNAGLKCAARKRTKPKSGDLIRKSPQNIGDLLSTPIVKKGFSSSLGTSGMGMKISQAKPTAKPKRPIYKETTSTPFELIKTSGKISKCAGCEQKLKKGPTETQYKEYDESLCIRHKEKDHVFLPNHNYWKDTFGNKHYHVFNDCISTRNSSFVFNRVKVLVPIDDDRKDFLSSRFI